MHQHCCRESVMISLYAFFSYIFQDLSRHQELNSIAASSSTESSLTTSLHKAPAHFTEPILTNQFSPLLVELTLAAFAWLSLTFCYLFHFCAIPTIIIFSGLAVPMLWFHLLPSFQFLHLSSNDFTLHLLLFQFQPFCVCLSTFVDYVILYILC